MSDFIDMEYLQGLHEEFMEPDSILIEELTEGDFDRETGKSIYVKRKVYEGPGLVVNVNPAQPHIIGGAERAVSAYEIHVPIGEEGVKPNQICTVEDSEWNPSQVDTVFRIKDRIEGTYNTAQRFSAVVERIAT